MFGADQFSDQNLETRKKIASDKVESSPSRLVQDVIGPVRVVKACARAVK